MRSAWKLSSVANRAARSASPALAACRLPSSSPTAAAVATCTSPYRSCAFHTGYRSGGRYAMAKRPASGSWASSSGTLSGRCREANRIQAHS